MPRYAIIEKSTGNIRRLIAGPSVTVLRRNVGEDEEPLLVGDDVSDATHRYDYAAGKLVHFTPTVTVDEVKRHASALIAATDWRLDRARDRENAEEIEALKTYREAVRQASNRLEQYKRIPSTFRDSRYWPAT